MNSWLRLILIGGIMMGLLSWLLGCTESIMSDKELRRRADAYDGHSSKYAYGPHTKRSRITATVMSRYDMVEAVEAAVELQQREDARHPKVHIGMLRSEALPIIKSVAGHEPYSSVGIDAQGNGCDFWGSSPTHTRVVYKNGRVVDYAYTLREYRKCFVDIE